MKRSEVFKSKYLTSADLAGKPVVLEIISAPLMTLKGPNGSEEQAKTVLHFRGTQKLFPLNRTNWDAVADATGEDDTDRWAGRRIEVFPTTTEMSGKVVDCIRVRKPSDELPLKAAKPSAAKAAKPSPAKARADDMDDTIPFALAATAIIPLLAMLGGLGNYFT
jgi:hypothetical protein